jgi:hypothetical protein
MIFMYMLLCALFMGAVEERALLASLPSSERFFVCCFIAADIFDYCLISRVTMEGKGGKWVAARWFNVGWRCVGKLPWCLSLSSTTWQCTFSNTTNNQRYLATHSGKSL